MKMLISARPWAACLLVLCAGCASPGPQPVPAPGSPPPPADVVQVLDEGLLAAEATALRQEVYQLKAGLAALQVDLATLSNRLSAARTGAAPAAEPRVDLDRLRADMAREQARMRERMADVSRQLEVVRAEARRPVAPVATDAEGSAEEKRVRAESAEREQKLREAALAEETRLQNEIKELRKQMESLEAKAGDPRQVRALQKELEAVRRQAERDREIAVEREKQLKALREALEARPAPPLAMVMAPVPAVEPSVVTEQEAAASAPAEQAEPVPVAAEPPAATAPEPPEREEPAPVAEVQAEEPKPEEPKAEPAPAGEPARETRKKTKSEKAKPTPIQQVAAANVALQQGNLARAMALFRAALAEDDTLVGARIGLAACAYSMDDLETARARIEEVLATDDGNVQALGLRGILNWREGRLGEADEDSARAVADAPADAQLRNYRGIILHGLGRPEEAMDEFREAVRLDPGHAEAMLNLAVLLASSSPDKLGEAEEWYNKALSAGASRDEGLDRLLQDKESAP